jgi:signal transduction histidine kinase
VEAEIPSTLFDLPVRRNLFLAVKEALSNAAKHSEAGELFLRIFRRHHQLCVVVEDRGRGFEPSKANGDRNGLVNMAQRLAAIGGSCEVFSLPGEGCRITFSVPLPHGKRRWFKRAILPFDPQNELKNSSHFSRRTA